MKNKSHIMMVLAFLAAAGCTQAEMETPAEIAAAADGDILHARIESPSDPETKAYVAEDLRILWDEADPASVFKYITVNQKYTYQGEAGTNDGDFAKASSSSALGSPLDNIYAVYPYSSGITMSGDGTISHVQIPRTQSYREHSFGKDANVIVSATENDNLFFKNLCGFLRLRLYGDDVTVSKITLEGNNGEVISGSASVSVSPDRDPALSFDASDTYADIVLDCPGGIKLGTSAQTATDFWFVVPPTSFTKGFKVTVQAYGSSATFQKKASAPFTIERNGLKKMAALEVTPQMHYDIPEAVDLGLSVKWASFDIGATSGSFGHQFKWGETEQAASDYSYKWGMWDNQHYCLADLTKYCTVSEYGNNGFTDGKTKLDPEDDAATVLLGEGWRTPTEAEWRELFERTTSQAAGDGTLAIVFKSNVSGYTDRTISFSGPAYYMTSSLFTELPRFCYVAVPASRITAETMRNDRFYVRAVQGEEVHIPVTGVTLDKTSLQLPLNGNLSEVTATPVPAYASDGRITWTVADPSVATIEASGNTVYVTGTGLGETTLTATSADGGHTATCSVTVSYAQPETVDLGLSVKWASMNLGANTQTQAGAYFAWGETLSKSSYSWGNYRWCDGSGANTAMTKYCTMENAPGYDGLSTLSLEDDAAHAHLGDKWRMPTHLEWKELLENCTMESMRSGNTVYAYRFTSKKAGYTNKSIVIPVNGAFTNALGDASSITLWTSSLYYYQPAFAQTGAYTSASAPTSSRRMTGLPIRPVYGDPSIPTMAIRIGGYTSTTLAHGPTLALSVSTMPENATDKPTAFTWTSSDTGVATVSSSGKVTAVGNGDVTIWVQTADGGLSDRVDLKVTEPTATSIRFDKSSYSVKRGETIKLTPVILPAEAASLPVTWKSSNTSWATVDGEGNVTGKLVDKTVTITATVGSLSATCSVKVEAPDLVSFTLSPSPVTLFPFDKVKVTAVLNPSDAKITNEYWYIDADRIAGVGNGGDGWREINAFKAGTAVLRVVLNGNIERTVTINVLDPAPEAVDLGLSVMWGDRNFLAQNATDAGRYYTFPDATRYQSTESDVVEYYTDSDWRLPTKDEFQELIDNCTYAKVTQNGASGLRFTSKKNGKTLFLPNVGGYLDSKFYSPEDINCNYWSSSPLDTDSSISGRLKWFLPIQSDTPYTPITQPTEWSGYQFPIRPVKN